MDRRDGRARSSGRRVLTASVVLAGAALALTACAPSPGEARVRLSGAVNGSASGPSAECYGPGHFGDEYATWIWSGTIDGRATRISIGDIGSYVAVLLVDEEWLGSTDSDAAWSFSEDDGVVRLETRMRSMDTSVPADPVDVQLTLTCP